MPFIVQPGLVAPQTLIHRQAVSYPGFGQQMLGTPGLGFQFLTQVVHVDPQVVGLVGIGLTPNLGQQLALRDHLPRVPH